MNENFDFKKIEKNNILKWEKGNPFSPKIEKGKKPFSMFLNPPNASGPLHIGNALLVAIQDILARYHRAKGDVTLWIPSTDHGGYETQVSFEKELEKIGKNKSDYAAKELFSEIEKFVEHNNTTIKTQLMALGASVDWSRFRFTMDEESLLFVDQMFKRMAADNLMYRNLNMVSYCPSCSTFLADIEMKKREQKMPLYHVKFNIQKENNYLTLATTRPEFIFSITHVLVHPTDQRWAPYIGKTLINPVTGQPVEVIASKRKWDPKESEKFLSGFSPSFEKYDYGYALRHSLPSRNLLDWQGNMIERHPGLKPSEARMNEISFLEKNGYLEKVEDDHLGFELLCKKGHATENLIVFTWFLRLDDEKTPLRKPAIEATQKNLAVFPVWRKKGLLDWMGKMNDWPIARQNVWGIKIPVWYDVSEPERFMVWFINKKGEKNHGNLKHFLEEGITLEEIARGLEHMYAGEGAKWVLQKEANKPYLPETDTFDTWFSSGQWATIVFGNPHSEDFSYFYPSDSIVTGHDLLMLSVSREIMLSFYLTNKLPYRLVYLHPILRGKDGQKMSKSVGNVTSLEYYLEKFGVDVTRMALISYLSSPEDFYFSEERLQSFQNFSRRLWNMGQIVNIANSYKLGAYNNAELSQEDTKIVSDMEDVIGTAGTCIKKYMFAAVQEKTCGFLATLENYAESIKTKNDVKNSMSLLRDIYEKYLIVLHPFMPFMTEELYGNLYNKESLLAAAPWPQFKTRKV